MDEAENSFYYSHEPERHGAESFERSQAALMKSFHFWQTPMKYSEKRVEYSFKK